MRIDKLLAHAGFGTRKQVKQLIKKRLVMVDNNIVSNSSMHVNPDEQSIMVGNEKVNYQEFIYIMLHKPKNYVTATYDRFEKTVLDLVNDKYKHYTLSPVGRLDKDTEGLILLTNDGDVNHKLTSPKNEIFKTYLAKIHGKITEEHVDMFKQGIILDDGYRTKKAMLEIIQSGSVSKVKVSIAEGKFHQIKRMFKALNMEVLYLKRVSIGKLYLDDTLPLGNMRLLNDEELTWLLTIKRGEQSGTTN